MILFPPPRRLSALRHVAAAAAAVGLCTTLLVSCQPPGGPHVGSLKVGHDEAVTKPADAFAPTDHLYAVATVDGIPAGGSCKLVLMLVAAKVTGQADDFHVAALDKSFVLDRDSTATYHLSPPTNGWPLGKYRVEARLSLPDGQEKGHRAVPLTVAAPPPAR